MVVCTWNAKDSEISYNSLLYYIGDSFLLYPNNNLNCPIYDISSCTFSICNLVDIYRSGMLVNGIAFRSGSWVGTCEKYNNVTIVNKLGVLHIGATKFFCSVDNMYYGLGAYENGLPILLGDGVYMYDFRDGLARVNLKNGMACSFSGILKSLVL